MKFVEVTRPDGTKILVSSAWVYMIRAPLRNEKGNTVLVVGSANQQIMETIKEVKELFEKE